MPLARFFLAFSSLILAIILGGCVAYPKYLDVPNTKFFELSLDQTKTPPQLHIVGLSFHSALSIKRVEVLPDGRGFNVMVELTPARSGLSGRFEAWVPIPDPDTIVTFGPEKQRIWPRQPGAN